MSSIRVSFYLPPLPSLIKPLFRCIRSGAFSHKKDSTIKREAFFIEFADRIRSFASLCRSCFSLSRSVSLTFVFFVFIPGPTLKTAKLAVTGGFRSVGPMEEALAEKSCDCMFLHPSSSFRSFSIFDPY